MLSCRTAFFFQPLNYGIWVSAYIFYTLHRSYPHHSTLQQFPEESLRFCEFHTFIKILTCYKLLKIVGLGISRLNEWLRSLWTFVKSFDVFPAELSLAWRCGCLADWVTRTFPLCPDKLSVLCWYLHLVSFLFLFLECIQHFFFTVLSQFKTAFFLFVFCFLYSKA